MCPRLPRFSAAGAICLATLTCCRHSGSTNPAAAGRTSLDRAVRHVTDAASFRHAHWGILVRDLRTGAALYARNADKLFAPASTTKLFSAAAALAKLGPDHRFRTPVYASGRVDETGRLAGPLILVGSGDLTMGGRTTQDGRIAWTDLDHIYANWRGKGELTRVSPVAGLAALARQVRRAGIRSVAGVLIDDRLFERARSTGSGPQRIAPIAINDNLVDVTIRPARVGEPAELDWRPRCAMIHIDNEVQTVARDGTLAITVRSSGDGRARVIGTIPAGHGPTLRVFEPGDPVWLARALFVEALAAADVEVRGSPAEGLPRPEAYARMAKVAELVSPPFVENLELILKVSHNLHASTLPLLLAASEGRRSLRDGLHIQREVLRRLGVDVASISFGGAAGGARADLVTPDATVRLLCVMAARRDFDRFKRALPVIGVDGTLADTVEAGSPVRGKFFAKTGTYVVENTMNDSLLLTSKALAGYIEARSGRELAFALFVNNVHLDGRTTRQHVGRVLAEIAELFWEAL